MAIQRVNVRQIATAGTSKGAVLYGLTDDGVVYEYNFSREVWIPLHMQALPENGVQENVIGLRGPGGFSATG
jgi:hypothetical protein